MLVRIALRSRVLSQENLPFTGKKFVLKRTKPYLSHFLI